MSNTYRFETTLSISLTETFDKEFNVEVDFQVNPYYPMTAVSPAEPESAEIISIKIETDDNVWIQAPDWIWNVLADDPHLHIYLLEHANAEEEYQAEQHADFIRESSHDFD